MRIWLKWQVYVNYLKLEMGVLIALMMPGNERNVEHMIVICIIYHEGKYSGLFMNFLQKF